jgi:hypothetical protein
MALGKACLAPTLIIGLAALFLFSQNDAERSIYCTLNRKKYNRDIKKIST